MGVAKANTCIDGIRASLNELAHSVKSNAEKNSLLRKLYSDLMIQKELLDDAKTGSEDERWHGVCFEH